MGERTPYLDPNARGALVGLKSTSTRAHIVRAILEGVAFSLRDTLTIFEELSLRPDAIRLSGGGAGSGLWRQIHADIFGVPVEFRNSEGGAAFGAALLAGVGVGVWDSIEMATDHLPEHCHRLSPNPTNVRLMNQQYEKYRKLYSSLSFIWREQNGGQA